MVKTTTLGNLIAFMHVYNLRFGAATTPHQKLIYDQLYPMLDDVRDRITKESKSERNRPGQSGSRGRLLQQAGSRSTQERQSRCHPIPNSENRRILCSSSIRLQEAGVIARESASAPAFSFSASVLRAHSHEHLCQSALRLIHGIASPSKPGKSAMVSIKIGMMVRLELLPAVRPRRSRRQPARNPHSLLPEGRPAYHRPSPPVAHRRTPNRAMRA